MDDPLIPLCQAIADKLQENPQADPTALVAYLREVMAAAPDLAAAIQTDPRVMQINQGDATAFQTWVTGGVANIGIHLNDVDATTLTLVLERFFREQLSSTISLVRDEQFRRNRSQMLGEVKRQVTSQLAQSLPHEGLIDLRKETRSQQVTPHHEFKGPPQRAQLPPETKILEVFDHERIAGRLLILGTPGAGKTTLLLHLAKELLTRAESDPDAPIPVYVNLSSWTDETQLLAHSLAHWLVAELKERYGVRKDIGQHWLEEHRLVPLLDGLNELPSTRQERCVQAINQFQHEYRPPHLVVCCRLAEFHIPADLVVDRWTSDGERGLHRHFLFRQDVWTMFRG